MTRGSVHKNFGPCVVCGEENIGEEYRKITEYSIIKVHKCDWTIQKIKILKPTETSDYQMEIIIIYLAIIIILYNFFEFLN